MTLKDVLCVLGLLLAGGACLAAVAWLLLLTGGAV